LNKLKTMNDAPQPQTSSQVQSKVWPWIVIGLAVIVVLALLYLASPVAEEIPTAVRIPSKDNTAMIEKDLNSVQLEGLDAELNDIEKELSTPH